MRVRWNYVLTTTLVAVALGAPFTLQYVPDSQGSGAFAPQAAAAAPPASPAAVVQMAALPGPKIVVRPHHVLQDLAPRVVPTSSSLASVRIRSAPAGQTSTAVVKHSIRKHPPAPVDTRRAPDPVPATPTASVAPVAAQPVNLNSSNGAAPAPAPVAVPVPIPTATVPVPEGEHVHYHGHEDGHDH